MPAQKSYCTDFSLPSSILARCSLEFGDRNLLVTYIKRDEGFESDGESTKSNDVIAINDQESSCTNVEEKIIKDHVFKINPNVNSCHDHLSSSANSSGSDSSDEHGNGSHIDDNNFMKSTFK